MAAILAVIISLAPPVTPVHAHTYYTWYTKADFDAGVLSNVDTSFSEGDVVLAPNIDVGDGSWGDLTIHNQTVYTDNIRTSLTSMSSTGDNVLYVADTTGFSPSQEIFITQTFGVGAGKWETKYIQSVSPGQIILTQNLIHPYFAEVFNSAQVIVIPHWHNVTLYEYGLLTCHNWDGLTGGIIFFRASGTVDFNSFFSSINAGGSGFNGGNGGAGGSSGDGGDEGHGGTIYGDGYDGHVGGTGGEGGSGAWGCGAGGDGALQGYDGDDGSSGTTGKGPEAGGPDQGGSNGSSNNLSLIQLGSGGGGGHGGRGGYGAGGGGGGGGGDLSYGSDGEAGESGGDGGSGGNGGKGGGVVIIFAKTIDVTEGFISASGAPGATGDGGEAGGDGGDGGYGGYGSGVCGGSGGGGGGGAEGGHGGNGGGGGGGGVIWLAAENLILSEYCDLVRAQNGAGGYGGDGGSGGEGGDGKSGECNWYFLGCGEDGDDGPDGPSYSGNTGGSGSGVARIRLDYNTLSGCTNPSPSYTSHGMYYATGTIASDVKEMGIGESGYRLGWQETLPANTDITFEIRASDTLFAKDDDTIPWISVGNSSPVLSGFPEGRYIQWRATLSTSDSAYTPVLRDVRVDYMLYPEVTTNDASNITTDAATLNMSYTVGDFDPVDVRFAYKKSADTIWTYTPWVSKSALGTHAESVSGLDSNTQYDFKAQLKHWAYGGTEQEIEGSIKQFTTGKMPPTVTTEAADGITTEAATFHMSYTLGDFSPVDVRFAYKKAADAVWNYTSWVTDPGSPYTPSVPGLTSNTTYDFKAQLQYDTPATMIEGDTLQFTTLKIPPTVTTDNVNDITTDSATLHLSYTMGDYETVDVRFAYKKAADAVWTETSWVTLPGSPYAESVSGLTSNTPYDFKAQLQYDTPASMIEGDTLQFTTEKILPTVTTDNVSSITTDSATLNMSYTVGDYSTVDIRFAYKKAANAVWNYTSWVTDPGSPYSEAISGLTSNTPYDFKAQLQYDTPATMIEGDIHQFTTEKIPPAVTTDNVSDITTDAATLNMSYTIGDYSPIDVRFAYKKAADAVWNYTSWVTDPGSPYSEAISGLTSNTQYDFRAELKYDSTEIQGSTLQFTTLRIGAASVASATGAGTVTFATSAGSIIDLTALATTPCGSLADLTFPYGFFSFDITTIPAGSTVTITITLPSTTPANTQYWKCQNGAWVNTTSLLGDNDGDNVLTLTITDGGLGDADGLANGTIVDPGGPAIPVLPGLPAPRASASPPSLTWLPPVDIRLHNISVSPGETQAGQPVTVLANVVNNGATSGSYNVALVINGRVEQQRTVEVSPGAAYPVKFTVTKAQPGTYTVDIGGQKGSFTVIGDDSGSGGDTGKILLLAAAAIAVMLVPLLIIVARRRFQGY